MHLKSPKPSTHSFVGPILDVPDNVWLLIIQLFKAGSTDCQVWRTVRFELAQGFHIIDCPGLVRGLKNFAGVGPRFLEKVGP